MQADPNPLPLPILDGKAVIGRVKQGEIAFLEIVRRRSPRRAAF
jgi:hypothetical protein